MVAIHNLAHQGTALAPEFPIFNLPQSAYNELEWIYEEPDGRRTPVRPSHHLLALDLRAPAHKCACSLLIGLLRDAMHTVLFVFVMHAALFVQLVPSGVAPAPSYDTSRRV